MIKTLNTKSKIQKSIKPLFKLKKKYSASKSMLVKKIVYDVKVKKTNLLLNTKNLTI